MGSTASASIDSTDPAARLRRAHLDVLTRLTDSATGGPAPVRSPTPIRTLPSSVASVVAARSRAGLAPVGEFFPRRTALRRVGVAALALAVTAAVVGVAALATGRDSLAMITLATLVVLALAGVAVAGWALADPLRIGSSDRAVVDAASRWAPGRSPAAPGSARALVAIAATAAQRVVDSPAWRSGVLIRAGVAVPLATELDLTEQRATRAVDEDWGRLVTRVAALVAYAEAVSTLDDGAEDLAAADVEVLAFLLSTAIYSVG